MKIRYFLKRLVKMPLNSVYCVRHTFSFQFPLKQSKEGLAYSDYSIRRNMR